MSTAADHTAASAEPCWLSASEQTAWLRLGSLVTRLPAALDADLHAAAGLSLFEYLVLSVLSEAPNRTLRMSELGLRVSASPSRLSHGVGRLERRGWVCRAPLPTDGRQIIATLTTAGYRKVEATAPEHVRSVRQRVIDSLSPAQLRQLDGIASTILTSLDAAPPPCRAAVPSNPPCGPTDSGRDTGQRC